MELVLKRTYGPGGTNGELFHKETRVCSTIELPWKKNQRRISCIPEGKYELQKRSSPRFGRHLLVKDVTGRSYILIHAFNHALRESKGCIAPVTVCTGEGRGSLSRQALQRLLGIVYPALERGETVLLTIQKEKHA